MNVKNVTTNRKLTTISHWHTLHIAWFWLITKWRHFFCTEAHKRFLIHLISHHINLTENNYHWCVKKHRGTGSYCCFIIDYYFNHSCFPNVCQSKRNGIMSITVVRPVQKGEQLFFPYLYNAYNNKKGRTKELLENCHFQCKCELCQINSIPVSFRMESDPNLKALQSVYDPEYYAKRLYSRKQIDQMKEMCFNFLRKYRRSKWYIQMG